MAPIEMGANFISSGISDAYSRPSGPALTGAPRVVPADDPAERGGRQDAIAGVLAERAELRVAAAGAPAARVDCPAVLAGDPLAEGLAAERVRFSAAPKAARCAQAARVDWVPDDSHQAFPYWVGSARASAHWVAADLDQDDCLAGLMAADPRGPEADWAAPIPDGCSEQTGLPRADSALRMVDDHCALAVHPVPDERSRADSALADSAAQMADDHCAPADHPVQGGRSTADSAQGDSAAPMDDHCAPADHRAPDARSVQAGSVAAGCSESCFQADC